jgi:hypothetical protein
MANDYTGRHRSGQGSPGYSRGNREKSSASASEPQETVRLGLMSTPHIAGYHEHMRQASMHSLASQENAAKMNHPSAGSRSAEFAAAHWYHHDAAERARSNAVSSAVSGKTRGAAFSGRSVNFDLGRTAGWKGFN